MRDIFKGCRNTAFLRRFLAVFVGYSIFLTLFPFVSLQAQTPGKFDDAALVSTTVVISQFQGGGGNADDEFIELHNVSSSPVNLSGHRLVYRSSSGSTDLTLINWTASTVIPAGGYFLIARTGGAGGYDGTVTPNATYNSASLSASAGGIAIRSGAENSGTIIDAVGYGSASNSLFEGTRIASGPANNTSYARSNAGCTDTDNNSADFTLLNPSAPRNASTAVNICGGGSTPTNPSGTGSANPAIVQAGNSALLTVTVTPGTNPASSGITVSGDLTAIGGAANQTFFDNGTNGDETSGNNVFSFNATVSAGTSDGAKTLPVSIADGQGRTASGSISLSVGTPPVSSSVHLTLGNPSGAVTDVNQPFNYLLDKPQYAVSYHRDRAIPNWISWHLDSSWIGSTPRQDDYRPDSTLPAGWYQVQSNSYSGSGFDRGHHTPSGDRTSSVANNSATFLMTNMMPQAPGNNQGPWEKLETFSRSLAGQGSELYIVMGGVGTGGTGTSGFASTVDAGRVTVPAQTWKVILVLPSGSSDVSRVTTSTRTIAVIMPNVESIRQDGWEKYLATVDQVETLTGYDFFSNVDAATQAVIESKVDAATNTAPAASAQTTGGGEDSQVTINLSGTDANVNSELIYSIVSGPANGTLAPVGNAAPGAASYTYTPNANFFGSDSFTFKANDTAADSAPATVTINVTSVNDAPAASADSKSTNKNIALAFPAANLTANDNAGAANESGQTLTVSQVITTAQTRGTVSLSAGQITYTPQTDYTGAASFDYEVCDNGTTNGAPDAKCSIATVNVNVLAPTAAQVTVGGKAVSAKGRGVAGAFVSLTDANGNIRQARTNPFGYFQFEAVLAGEIYILNVGHKSYKFTPQVVAVAEEISEIIITAQP